MPDMSACAEMSPTDVLSEMKVEPVGTNQAGLNLDKGLAYVQAAEAMKAAL